MRCFKEDIERWREVCIGKSPEHAREAFGELYPLLWGLQVVAQYIGANERTKRNRQIDTDYYKMYYTLDFVSLYTDIIENSFEELYEKLPEKILLKRYGIESVSE